jgi:hypothetical protein
MSVDLHLKLTHVNRLSCLLFEREIGVINVDILSKIRRWYFRDKLSLREIARRTEFSRNTVRRYLRDEISEPVYPKRQTPSKLDAFADKLRQWLCLLSPDGVLILGCLA